MEASLVLSDPFLHGATKHLTLGVNIFPFRRLSTCRETMELVALPANATVHTLSLDRFQVVSVHVHLVLTRVKHVESKISGSFAVRGGLGVLVTGRAFFTVLRTDESCLVWEKP